MPDFSFLQKAAIELMLIAILMGVAAAWGDIHRGNADTIKEQAAILKAVQAQAQKDSKTTAAVQAAYDSLDKDQDGDIQYGIQQHKLYLAAAKKHPLPADCVLPADILRIYNASGKAK